MGRFQRHRPHDHGIDASVIVHQSSGTGTSLPKEIMAEAPMKILREERDNKLLETDKYTSIPDWPHPSEEVKQAWITYRQELRDLPATATPQLDENGNLTNVSWSTPPS